MKFLLFRFKGFATSERLCRRLIETNNATSSVMSSQLRLNKDKKLLKSLNSDDAQAILGDQFKSEHVRLIMVKSEDDSNEYEQSGRALCIRCQGVLSAKDGGHISRHVAACLQRRAISEPLPDEETSKTEDTEEPPSKQRKLTEFSRKRFTKDQTDKITYSMAKHALMTGKSFNYVASHAMKSLLIDVANATGNGVYGKEALDQIPCRQTIQKKVLSMSDKLLQKAFDMMRPFAGKRVNFLCDHGKLIMNYLSLFAPFLDDSFQLKLLPIGFLPCPDGKSGSDTAAAIFERLLDFGWTEQQVKVCSITADGALPTLADHFNTCKTQNRVTLHHVLPAYKLLESKWRRYEAKVFTELKERDSYDLNLVHALATSGLVGLRYYYAEFDDIHYGAVLLNPKTKKMTMFDELERERAVSFVTDLLPLQTTAVTPRKSTIPDFISEMSDSCEELPKHDDLKRFMEEYVDSQSEETIEEYWTRKRFDFPCLHEVAGRILSVIPSESVCETTFSTASFLLDKRRSRLQYSAVEKVVVGCQIAARFPEWID
uniref:Dimer_Tnp_hAT domain-containing protein n=2 Tax=Caenorhabditis tropicalis TaxID=1561998 RepID=A0A1I7UI10_9PELO